MTQQKQTLLEFPCLFPIKAIGRTHNDLDVTVVGIIKKHVPDIREGAIESKLSKGGKYTSVTVTITATNKTQLDNIYQDLCICERVMMAL